MLLCIFAANRQRVASRINFRLQAEPASFPRLSARAAKLWGVARLAACRSVWIVNAFPFDAETLLAARPKSRRNSAAGRDRSKNFFAHCRVGDALAMNYSGLMPMGGWRLLICCSRICLRRGTAKTRARCRKRALIAEQAVQLLPTLLAAHPRGTVRSAQIVARLRRAFCGTNRS
jgi:hypothetical protein